MDIYTNIPYQLVFRILFVNCTGSLTWKCDGFFSDGALTLVLLLDKEVVNGGLGKSFFLRFPCFRTGFLQRIGWRGGLLVSLDDLSKLSVVMNIGLISKR